MICYARLSAQKSPGSLQALFQGAGASEQEICIDDSISQKQDGTVYAAVRASVISSGQTLVLDSLSSLGKNAKENSKELNLFMENNVRIIVLDIPSTVQNTANSTILLSEVYRYLAAG